MTKMPAQINVGRWAYTVSENAQEWAERGSTGIVHATTYGATNHQTLRIIINPGTHARQKADTLLHEVLHCVWEVCGVVKRKELADDVDVEETTIGQITPWLALVLVDNPDLVAYLSDPE